MEELDSIYNELIMEHSMNSYNKKKLKDASYEEITQIVEMKLH